MKKTARLLLALFISCALLCACARAPEKFVKTRYDLFDTVCTLTGYAEDQATFERLSAPMWETLERYHRALDAYNAYQGVNNLYLVNQTAVYGPVRAEDELFDLLLWLKGAQKLTGGRVNVAMGAVLSLWHDAREAGGPPPEENSLLEAAKHIDFECVILDEKNKTVYFTDPLLKIDLGSVGKGAAARAAVEALAAAGLSSYILNLGGNVSCGTAPEDGRESWRVSIQNPDPSGDAMGMLNIKRLSAVTSGDYQRYFTWNGVNYHHLIDPDTLAPARYVTAVTILCEDPRLADLYSTCVFLMPYEEGRAFVEQTEGVEAYWILIGGETRATEGFQSAMEARK